MPTGASTAGVTAVCQARPDAGAPRRRHLRALPPVPRAPARAIATPTASRSARRGRSCSSVLGMLEGGATHLGVATDHVIESFRNDLWDDYKTGEGIDPELLRRSSRCSRTRSRRSASRCGRWSSSRPTTRSASAAAVAAADDARRAGDHLHPRQGPRAVRRRQGRAARPAQGRSCSTPTACARSSACCPASIPDWLALVGDSADGFPGLPGFGAKTAAALLAALRAHRGDPRRRAASGTCPACAASTGSRRRSRRAARSPSCFKVLATLRTDADVGAVDDWEWTRPDRRASATGASGSDRRDSLDRAAEARAARGGS